MDMEAELARLRYDCQKNDNDIEQTLGRALGYPRYCDDQINFPGSTDADGVCVGDQVAASLAMQAADRIRSLTAELETMTARKNGWRWVALLYRAALRFTNVDYDYHMRAWSILRRSDRQGEE